MKRAEVAAAFFAVTLVGLADSACVEEGCTEGESAACACTNGDEGAQVCLPDGTFGECTCGGDATGASTGASGSTHSGSWDQFTITRQSGTYYLGAFEVDASGDFGAGPDQSPVAWTVTGTITAAGSIEGTANAPGWSETYTFSGSCQSETFCSGSLSGTGGMFQMTR
jgi:hypothetical protein